MDVRCAHVILRNAAEGTSAYHACTRRLLLATALLLLAVPTASAAAPSILYSADARSATISGARLSMPANTHVTWFADRPARQAGMTTLAALASIWTASGFAADPPNAAVVLTNRGATRTHVVELSNPRHRNKQVSFHFRVIPNGVEAGRRQEDPVIPGTYGRAAIFVDDAAYPPCQSVQGLPIPEWPSPLSWTGTSCIAGPGTGEVWASVNGSACGLTSPRGVAYSVTTANGEFFGFSPPVSMPVTACPVATPLPIDTGSTTIITYSLDQSFLFTPS